MDTLESVPSVPLEKTRHDSYDEKNVNADKDSLSSLPSSEPVAVWEDVAGSREKVIETDIDIATRLVSLEDDPTQPVLTFRMWVIGIGLSCFGAVLGQIFYFRPQTLYVSQLFIQVIGYILGKLLEDIIPGPGNPRAKLRMTDSRFWRFMNPGPFNIKEHVAITIFASTAADSALAINIFATDELYYNITPNVASGIFTLIGSQMIGYGLGGMMRSFLVYPTYIVFPNLLPVVQLFDALHRGKGIFMQKKRVRLFWALFIGVFVWEWFPEYIAPTLTGVSIFCLANQDSAWFSRVFGGATANEGLGILALCFDWNYIGSGGGSLGALFTPLGTQLTLYTGTGLCAIAFCIAYVTNAWDAKNFPWLSQALYNFNGTRYDQLSILDDRLLLDEEKLEQVGLPYFASSQVITTIGFNFAIGATIVHVFLWYRHDIIDAIKRERSGEKVDPHREKMKLYPEVNIWWYLTVFLGSFAMAMATVYTSKSNLPWWGLIVALLISAVFLPLVTTTYAIAGFAPNVENLVQMIGAALIPGNPQANMYFSLYGYNTLIQALQLIRDLKMGQYTKLPPRVTFLVQSLGTIIGGLLNYVIMKVIIDAQREILLDIQGTNVWSGQQVQNFNSNAITWGALGKQLYKPGGRYAIVPFSILIGLAVPVPFWLIHKKFPNVHADQVVTPILCWALGYLSSGIKSSVFVTFLLTMFSQFYLRRYRPRWFRKYNYLVSAALDGGTQVMVFVYTFAVGGGSGTERPFPHWALNPTGNPDYCKRLT